MREPSAGRSNSLIAQRPDSSRDLHVVGNYRPAFTCGDLLVRIETEDGCITKGTNILSYAESSTETVGQLPLIFITLILITCTVV